MNECTVDPWNYILVIGLVAITAVIVFVATWTHKENQRQDLLREQAAERASENIELRNARIVNKVYGDMRGIDIANLEE